MSSRLTRSLFVSAALGLSSMALASLPARTALAAPAADAPVAAPLDARFQDLAWRNVGPFRGGRALAVAGSPTEPNTFYFGAAAGGVWKTIDAGANWKPILDSQPVSSIGAVAVASSDPAQTPLSLDAPEHTHRNRTSNSRPNKPQPRPAAPPALPPQTLSLITAVSPTAQPPGATDLLTRQETHALPVRCPGSSGWIRPHLL